MSCWEKLAAHGELIYHWKKVVIFGGLALAFYVPYKWFTSVKEIPVKHDWAEGVVYLHQLPRTKNVPSVSVSSLKLETWLRMADIHYEIVPCPLTTRSRAVTLPFIKFNGQVYSGSAFIIRSLTKLLNKSQIEQHLNDEQRASSRAFEKLAELSLMPSHTLFRIKNLSKFLNLWPYEPFGIFYLLPIFLFKRIYTSTITSWLISTEIGHSYEEQVCTGCDDLVAISKYLGAKHYFTGFKPTNIDATLFSVISQIVFAPYESDHLILLRNDCPNLIEYVERIKKRFWPDWDEATAKFTTNTDWKKSRSNSYIKKNVH